MADGQHAVDAVIPRLRKDFPDLAGVEVPDPHVGEPRIRGGEHQVGEDDGGVGLGRIDSVVRTHPGFLVAAADDQDYRRAIARMHLVQPGKRLFALDHPDADRLHVLGRGSHPAGLQDHFQLGCRYGVMVEGMAGIPAFQDVHECIGAVFVLLDLLLHVGEVGAVLDLGEVAQAAEECLLHSGYQFQSNRQVNKKIRKTGFSVPEFLYLFQMKGIDGRFVEKHRTLLPGWF